MDKAIFIPSATIGLILVAIYIFSCIRSNRTFHIQIMINAVLQASGIVCGVVLVGSTFFDNLKKYLQNIDLYILISGLAVLTVSVQSVHRDLFKKES